MNNTTEIVTENGDTQLVAHVAPKSKQALLIENAKEKFLEITTTERWQTEEVFATQLLRGNDYLFKIANKNKASMNFALLNLAATGLTLNPVRKLAYLVPRDGKVILEPSYMGMKDVLTSCGAVQWIKAHTFREKDQYIDNAVHRGGKGNTNPFSDRGEILGYIAIAKLGNGDYMSEFLDLEQLERIRSKSESWKKSRKYSPWENYPNQMGKKSAIRRLCKAIPVSHLKQIERQQFDAVIDMHDQSAALDFKPDDDSETETDFRPEVLAELMSAYEGSPLEYFCIEKKYPNIDANHAERIRAEMAWKSELPKKSGAIGRARNELSIKYDTGCEIFDLIINSCAEFDDSAVIELIEGQPDNVIDFIASKLSGEALEVFRDSLASVTPEDESE